MKRTLVFILLLGSFFAKGQKVQHIFVNLYTDSLKKGTYNYINIDGQLANGRYIPLDSTHLVFWASAGYFKGNSLWLDPDYNGEKVDFRVTLRSDPAQQKTFTVYVKKKPDPELKSLDQLMKEEKRKARKTDN